MKTISFVQIKTAGASRPPYEKGNKTGNAEDYEDHSCDSMCSTSDTGCIICQSFYYKEPQEKTQKTETCADEAGKEKQVITARNLLDN